MDKKLQPSNGGKKMKWISGMGVLLFACSGQGWGQTPSSVQLPIEEVYSRNLLPIDSAMNGFVTPAFKFFEQNKLVGLLSGAPTSTKPLTSVLHAVPAAFAGKGLKEELSALHVTAPSEGGQVVIVYLMNGYCPPCAQIVEKVKGQLADVGWSKARFVMVQIVKK